VVGLRICRSSTVGGRSAIGWGWSRRRPVRSSRGGAVGLAASGRVGARRRGGELGDPVLVVGMVGVRWLEEIELGITLVEGDDAVLELGPVLGDKGGRLLDDHADVGRRVDDSDGARVCGHCRWGVRLSAGRGERRPLLRNDVPAPAAVARRRGEGQDGVAHGGGDSG
jgi:hypothetical protein